MCVCVCEFKFVMRVLCLPVADLFVPFATGPNVAPRIVALSCVYDASPLINNKITLI